MIESIHTRLPPGVYRQAFSYTLPLFVTTLLRPKNMSSQTLFWSALPSAIFIIQMPKKAALILSSLLCGVPVLFPNLFYVAYGAVVAQVYSTELLCSAEQTHLYQLAFKIELLGLFISGQVEVHLLVALTSWLAAVAIALIADPPSYDTTDPYYAMRKLISGEEPRREVNETVILTEHIGPRREFHERHQKETDSHIDGRNGAYTKLLNQEYRAYLIRAEEEPCDPTPTEIIYRFVAGSSRSATVSSWAFYSMFLLAEYRSIFVLSAFFQVVALEWPLLGALFLYLNGLFWEWIGFVTALRCYGGVVPQMAIGYAVFILMRLFR